MNREFLANWRSIVNFHATGGKLQVRPILKQTRACNLGTCRTSLLKRVISEYVLWSNQDAGTQRNFLLFDSRSNLHGEILSRRCVAWRKFTCRNELWKGTIVGGVWQIFDRVETRNKKSSKSSVTKRSQLAKDTDEWPRKGTILRLIVTRRLDINCNVTLIAAVIGTFSRGHYRAIVARFNYLKITFEQEKLVDGRQSNIEGTSLRCSRKNTHDYPRWVKVISEAN